LAKIKCFAISCSSDAELHATKLFVWGGGDNYHWFPQTESEAEKQIIACQKRTGCEFCDAETHPVIIQRTEETYKQFMSKGTKVSAKE